MSKPTKRKKPMRLWLVREEDAQAIDGGDLWIVESEGTPWLREHANGVWLVAVEHGGLVGVVSRTSTKLAPGECVELREVR